MNSYSTSWWSLLLIYRPRGAERLSWPCWLTYSGRFTHINGYSSAAGPMCRPVKVEKFRISQPVDSVIFTTIRKNTVEMWAAGEDLSVKESRSQLYSSVSQWQLVIVVGTTVNHVNGAFLNRFKQKNRRTDRQTEIQIHCTIPSCFECITLGNSLHYFKIDATKRLNADIAVTDANYRHNTDVVWPCLAARTVTKWLPMRCARGTMKNSSQNAVLRRPGRKDLAAY